MPEAQNLHADPALTIATQALPARNVSMRVLTAIPVYNEQDHIEPILREVLRHTGDVLVVDDGSTDGTPDRLALFPEIHVIRHSRNRGYGAGLQSAFALAIEQKYDGLVTLDCDGQHEPCRIPEVAEPLTQHDIVSGSRYLKVFDPTQAPPEARRRINRVVTGWLNDALGLQLTDGFCGFKAYRTSALKALDITDDGYAMPIQLWVQAVAKGLSIIEVPVPLIYLDENRAFGGALDNADYRLNHYRQVFEAALSANGLANRLPAEDIA